MSFISTKTVTLKAVKSDGTPSEDQLKLINQYTLKDLSAEELYTRTTILAHNAIDRDNEVFDDALLEQFVRTLPGKGLFNKHPMGWDGDSGPGMGRWYSARILDVTIDEARTLTREDLKFPPGTERAKLLETSYYLPRSRKNEDLVIDIDAGVASDVSIGFRAAQRTDITDGQGNVIARRLHAPGEALEASLVWLGAQPGARTVKNLKTDSNEEDQPMAMTPEEKQAFDQARADAKAQADKVTELQPKATAYDTIKQAVGDDLSDQDVIELAKHAKDLRGKMIEEIISAKRLKGLIRDDDTTAMDEIKSFYGKASLSMLQREHDAALKDVPGGVAQLKGGDPNRTGADPDAGNKGAKTGIFNPLFAA